MNCIENLKHIINSNQIIEKSILNDFFSMFSEKEIKKGEYLIETEQIISKVSFVCSGIFRAYYTDYNGNEITQAFLLKNDFIVSRLIPFSKSLVNIQAISNGLILVADIQRINDLAKKNHVIANILIQIISIYFDKNQDREIILRMQNAEENYKYFLKAYPNLINRIPHYYVASYLQISSTHLSRVRKKLSRK